MNNKVSVELQTVVCVATNTNIFFLLRGEKDPDTVNKLLSGPFLPGKYSTLSENIKAHINEQAGIELNYIEQLYSFGDAYRKYLSIDQYDLTIAYLGLCQNMDDKSIKKSSWQNIYEYFPYEDWREDIPKSIKKSILPALFLWAKRSENLEIKEQREQRIINLFGGATIGWQEELSLERYELLFEAGLVFENPTFKDENEKLFDFSLTGIKLFADHRRILATALGRIRGKLRYRPILFAFIPEYFTLQYLQQTIESILGFTLHKQNFRRSIANFVKETNIQNKEGKGRPARLFQYNSDNLQDHALNQISLPRTTLKTIFNLN